MVLKRIEADRSELNGFHWFSFVFSMQNKHSNQKTFIPLLLHVSSSAVAWSPGGIVKLFSNELISDAYEPLKGSADLSIHLNASRDRRTQFQI